MTNPPTSKRLWCVNEGYVECEKKKKTRCPECSRLLYLRKVRGDSERFKFPPHKVKVKAKKKPSRNQR